MHKILRKFRIITFFIWSRLEKNKGNSVIRTWKTTPLSDCTYEIGTIKIESEKKRRFWFCCPDMFEKLKAWPWQCGQKLFSFILSVYYRLFNGVLFTEYDTFPEAKSIECLPEKPSNLTTVFLALSGGCRGRKLTAICRTHPGVSTWILKNWAKHAHGLQ